MVLVDTSVWIEASRRDGDLAHKVGLENLLDAYEAAWCSPVKLEFMGGSRKEDRKKLAFWFDCIPYRLAEERHWELAKSNAWKLRDKGHTLPWNDLLIASMAMDLNMRVYAKDKHFELMAELIGLRLYLPGYGGCYAPDEVS
ncbi:MAG: PIN domain-containing protein [Puniceicoccaceae bacterium]|nr:PIN domain-containing protein [Puniceicoccaceae bacterium]HAY99584.1 VapC toxin family PIN domain ribonuclease [Opitutae bacterium]